MRPALAGLTAIVAHADNHVAVNYSANLKTRQLVGRQKLFQKTSPM